MANTSNTTIRAEATRFSKLFYKGRFTVPWHQRHYDWKKHNVEALLKDINSAIEKKHNCYFLGTIMLVEIKPRYWEINDGQQRMITVSLICAALCQQFHRQVKEGQQEGFALRMLFDIDDDSEAILEEASHYPPRIHPPEDYEIFYKQIIRGNPVATNTPLTVAWNTINEFFSEMNPQQRKKFFNFLRKNLEVVSLYVPQDIDANAVYETINSRGKQLDDFDLIRNYLYSLFRSREESQRKEILHKQLEHIRMILKKKEKAPGYMRCRLQCELGFLRKDSFYKDFREKIQLKKRKSLKSLKDDIFDLISRATSTEHLELFNFITASSPDPDCFQKFKIASSIQSNQRSLEVLHYELRTYKVSQPLVFSMLMLFIDEKDGRKKRRISQTAHRNLNRLATFILRTAFISKFSPSKFEEAFSEHAKEITINNEINDSEFIKFLKICDQSSEHRILNDDEFLNAIKGMRMTGKRKIKQFLFGINSFIQEDTPLIKRDLCTLEHILPQSQEHSDNWAGFKNTNPEDWVDRIGNLTLLSPFDNKPGIEFNNSFESKRALYAESSLKITRDLATLPEWTSDEIKKRQEEMAEQAVQVWKFE